MVQPHQADIQELTDFYNDPNVQAAAVHFVGHLRNYDKKKNDDYLYKAHEVSMSVYEKCPFNEVELDGEITDSPNDIMLLICAHLAELGLMPDYD